MLKLDNIVKEYVSGDETVHALRGVSIAFRESEFTSILGPSGCGKTTMLNIVGGLDRYTSGDLFINGKSTKEFVNADWDSYRNHNIGFIFQSYHLIPHLNVLENVELALTLSGVSKKERRERAKEALEKVGLKDQLKKMPNQMSGGQMQRVSIARALVNNPDIILADEPTGALDTNTSVQIMELLAEIAKTKLVIMVTHNPELAKRYSTRIVSLLDGEIVGDTNPYVADAVAEEIQEQNAESESPTEEAVQGKKAKKKRSKVRILGKRVKEGKRTYMPFWTAFTLSFRNLLTKKARTVLIAVAGSIGIIGVGLVFAVQNGFDSYVEEIEQTSLVGVPIMISPVTYNPDGVQAMIEEFMPSTGSKSSSDSGQSSQQGGNQPETGNQFTPDGKVIVRKGTESTIGKEASGSSSGGNEIADNVINGVVSMMGDLVAENVLSESFVTFCKDNIMEYGTVTCTYDFEMHLASKKNGSEDAYWVKTTDVNFTELVDVKGYVAKNYDVIGKLPTNKNEIVVILGKNNRLSSNVINALGMNPDSEILIKDLVGSSCPLKLVSNDGFYELTKDGSVSKYTVVTDQESMNTVYNDAVYTTDFKVVGVLRVKEDASNEILQSGIGYTSELWQHAYNQALKSEIVEAQNDNKTIDVFTGKEFTSNKSVTDLVLTYLGVGGGEDTQCNARLRQIGGDNTPILMLIYVDSFSNKNKVKSILDDYNATMKGYRETACAKYVSDRIAAYREQYAERVNTNNPLKNKTDEELTTQYTKEFNDATKGRYEIIYTDAAEMTTDTIGSIIDMISIILVCFAGISLVVSSLMIGIITYISVVERTKEIGILRSIGARKIDISNVFNAETIIIGTAAGLLGIFMTYILSIPINVIIKHYANLNANIAALSPLYAVGLVLLSVFLTFIAGLFPAKIAASRDPVVALRSE